MNAHPQLNIRYLGRQDYAPVWYAMKKFTEQRTPATISEVWVVEHQPVFTQGQAGKAEHILTPGDIPVVHTDRGGQVTYHAPGQLVCYLLLNLTEIGIGIRSLVNLVEQSIIDLLAEMEIKAYRESGAPGVYVNHAKIAAIGLRVKKQMTYHGLSLNIDMDLEPFSRINPCGFSGLAVTDMKMQGISTDLQSTAKLLVKHLANHLGYTNKNIDEATLPELP